MEKRERRKESRTRFVEDVEGIFIPDIIAKIYITQRWNEYLFSLQIYSKNWTIKRISSLLHFYSFLFFILIRERSLVDCWSRSKVLFSFFPFHNRWFFQKMGKINFSNGADRKVKLDRSFGRIDSVRFVEDVEGIFIPDIIAKIYITQRWNEYLFSLQIYSKNWTIKRISSLLHFYSFLFFILIRERSLVDCWSRSKVLFSFFPFHNRWFFQKMGKINFSNGADRKVKLDRSFGRIDSVDWNSNSRILEDRRFR